MYVTVLKGVFVVYVCCGCHGKHLLKLMSVLEIYWYVKALWNQ